MVSHDNYSLLLSLYFTFEHVTLYVFCSCLAKMVLFNGQTRCRFFPFMLSLLELNSYPCQLAHLFLGHVFHCLFYLF